MSLKLMCGRGGSGKSTYMLNDMPESDSTVYIVPEQYSFSAEQKLINAFGVVGLGKPHVLSFMRLADLVFSKYGSPEFITDNASFEMLFSYCANSINSEKLRLFDGLVKKKELAQTASSVITTFKRYRITVGMLSAAIEKTADPLLRKKLEDCLTIYKEYLTELDSSGVADQNDKLTILASTLSDESCDYLAGKHIYIDQFSDFDPCEYECIRGMLKRAERVTVALCTDFSAQFETVNRTYHRLMSIAKECNVTVEPVEELTEAMIGAKPMIRHLEQCYFSDSDSSFAGDDGSISLFCGKNRFSEIHNAARKIVKLVRDDGMRYRDISIIARDCDLYKGIIDRIFPFYDIPAFVDRKMPLSGHSVTMFITSILDVALSGFTYENIFSYIKSPFSPLSLEEADTLENYCLASGIGPYSWSKPFEAKSVIYNADSAASQNEYTPEKLSEINTLREKVYIPLNELITKLRKKSSVRDLCIYLFEFFEFINLEGKIKYHSYKLEEHGENLYALQTLQVYNILIDIFNDICAVLGEKTLSLREFHTTVMAGLQSVEIGTIPTSSDCVTIGSIDRIKGHGARAVFLIGANSGIFPSSPTENGLFSDDDKRALAESGIEMPPMLLQMTQSEQLLIYDALTCAGEKLYISYAAADNSSNAMMPSEIIERIKTVLPDIEFTDDLISLPESREIITSKKAVFDLLVSKIRACREEGKSLSDTLRAAAFYFSKDKIYSPLLWQAIDMTRYNNASAQIRHDLMKKTFGDSMKTSITRLETYNKCPFSFFAKYLLKLEPKRTFEISVSDSGSFLHDFLDRFSTFIVSSVDVQGNPLSWSSIDNDFIKLNTPVILREVLSGVNSRMLEMPRIKALFDRLCKTAEQSVYAVRNHIVKSDFIPLGYEISFDEEGRFKPVKIKLDDGKTIVLRGRIDRADEFCATLPNGEKGKFIRIVDYKSTDKTLSLSDVYNGVQLQLFVYLSALCDNGYAPAGILYCNLSDPIVEVSPDASEDEIMKKRSDAHRMGGIVLSEYGMLDHMGGSEILKTKKALTARSFNSMFRHLDKVIKKTAQNIFVGNFPIECEKDACKWCDYSHFCLFDQTFSGCRVSDIEPLKDEEVLELLEKEDGENEMDG